jgi:hypothetical protein
VEDSEGVSCITLSEKGVWYMDKPWLSNLEKSLQSLNNEINEKKQGILEAFRNDGAPLGGDIKLLPPEKWDQTKHEALRTALEHRLPGTEAYHKLLHLNNSFESHESGAETGHDLAQARSVQGGLRILDGKARGYMLNTLPQNIRKQVESQIDINGRITKGSLDKINSKDDNFLALRDMVNSSSTVEVMSARSDGTRDFDYTPVAEVRKDVYGKLIQAGFPPKQARQEANKNTEPVAHLGTTLPPSQSPSGNLRIIISDATGNASRAPMDELVATTGHELYGHGLLYIQGKPWEHGAGPSYQNFFKPIEERSKANFRGRGAPTR